MTRGEAEAFMARNPKITRERLAQLRLWAEEFQLERFYDFGAASNAEDARIDWLEVSRALEGGK